jgi:hypothetical protein
MSNRNDFYSNGTEDFFIIAIFVFFLTIAIKILFFWLPEDQSINNRKSSDHDLTGCC